MSRLETADSKSEITEAILLNTRIVGLLLVGLQNKSFNEYSPTAIFYAGLISFKTSFN